MTLAAQQIPQGEDLARLIDRYLGQPTPGTVMPSPTFKRKKVGVVGGPDGDITHELIEFDVEEGEPVEAHLMIPPRATAPPAGAPAVLCLHGTTNEAKDSLIGAGRPGRDLALQLARRGFVTLSPDHPCSGIRLRPGDNPYDTSAFYERHPDWSMVGKTIWDGKQSLNVLERIEGVNPAKLGVVGHSLGGQGSLFIGMDPRIGAAVCSCGFGSWRASNPRRTNWARVNTWYCYMPSLRKHFDLNEEAPFDTLDFIRLIAPRPMLVLSGLRDAMYGDPYVIAEITLDLHRHYQSLDAGECFAAYLFGGGHGIPTDNRALIAAWFERWLKDVPQS